MTVRSCPRGVMGRGPCVLPDDHHGPCRSTDGAGAFYELACGGPGACPECDLIDAREVLRLDAGGELHPLQKRPGWMTCPSLRTRMLTWARRTLEASNA